MPKTKTKDYYDLLGVSKEATNDEIRKAYRKLAHKYHPDKTGGDAVAEEKLKEINEAYDTLKNEKKRKAYDQLQQSPFGRGASFEGYDHSRDAGFGDDFADILSSMFGMEGAGMNAARRPARNLEAELNVTLNDIAEGATKNLVIDRAESCSECRGSGAAPGSTPETCTDCGGAGQLFRSDGMFKSSRPCMRCRGLGKRITTPCGGCEGTGRARARRELKVTIPAGIENNTRLRIKGEGEAGEYGAPAGDLFVKVQLEPDPFFTREGSDIVCEVPVTFANAALGAKITVPTLDGIANLTVPEGTQNGAKLRLRAMGLPVAGKSAKGDQFVRIVVEVPRKLSAKQKQLLREFEGIPEPESHPLIQHFKTLLNKLRGLS